MGKSVFVVEDEPMLSLDLQDILTELGFEVAGAAARIEPALELARKLVFDVAVLDVNIGDQSILPVAEIVDGRGLPIVFATGYGQGAVPEGMRCVVLEKPYDVKALERALLEALGA
jgi:DNA-binding response OmpR family regulator